MASKALRKEERIGLFMAGVAHVALVLGLLVVQKQQQALIPPPDRMTVTLSDDVGLTSSSPEPSAAPRAEQAPQPGEAQPEPAEPEPVPEPVKAAPPPPAPLPPRPVAKIEPKPVAKPSPRPVPVAQPRPQPRPTARPMPRPTPQPRVQPKTTAKIQPAPRTAARSEASPLTGIISRNQASRPAAATNQSASSRPATNRPAGASRVGNDFLKGVSGSQASGTSRNPPAATIGPQVRSALIGAVSREIKPHWQGRVPQGLDTDRLVTVLAWDLREDGSLAGPPRVVRQEGINDANRAQAARHAEEARRAVQLAAPFNLPAEYYSAWRRVSDFRFDKRLSQ